MRHSVPKTIALGLLSACILHSSGKPIVPIAPCKGVECRDILNNTIWSAVAHTEASPPALNRRASGGGRPNKPSENSPNAPQANPNDPNNPSGAGDQTGESGGFSETPDTEGGFSNSQETGGGFGDNGGDTTNPDPNAQPAAPDPNAQPATNNPGPHNAVQYAPSARNNHNQPAASANNPFNPATAPVPVINVAARRNEFRQTIIRDGLTGKSWFFYSGFDRSDNHLYKQSLEHKLGFGNGEISSMDNVLPIGPGKTYETDYRRYTASGEDANKEYYWAANSKAYAEAVEGKVYAMIPSGSSANQPYPDKGSNWWTFEEPELTRNARVESITVVPMKQQPDDFMAADAHEIYVLGPEQVIWRSDDEPIGFPASELHHLQRPDEPWTTLPEVELPEQVRIYMAMTADGERTALSILGYGGGDALG